MATALLNVEKRTNLKQSQKRVIRNKGSFPAVIYGKQRESQPIAVDSIEFIKTIREVGRNGIITLSGSEENVQVMLHELQTDPLKNEIIHADFYVVDMSAEVDVDVNVHLVGEAQGVKSGGVIQQSLHQVSVTALPGNIPTSIDVDITSLDVNETIQISDILKNGNYTINHEDSEVIASILPPKVEDTVEAGETQDGEVENEGTAGDEEEK
ncbi:large subunit ribosomal protein L25 [Bacillus mesophilus]|uniref:Large ribosomal subunit protein bL25 n=1 Tax=Bacillus mesophilus TaxID=1808955 RepID=A0A6M0QD06_9BACI|nr:50S ribosomal protein L25/general stress protein Ctc [Bacillus mesophilus]MBM7663423.1 large subunit ribosomal protein L25 [Bacillus mesophilus]NEY74127.1 50S ribosomal protein L25/general stress protein Ctc [Bacillus mesophilus]